MGSIQIDMRQNSQLFWPACCAMCNAPGEAEATASVSTSKGFAYYGIVFKWTNQRLSISFPVCRRHRVLCNLLDRPARWGFIDAALNLLVIPGVLWLALVLAISLAFGIKGDALDPYSKSLGVVLFGAMAMFYVAARVVKPVRLSGLHRGVLIISIKNDDYFRRFSELNASSNPD